MTALIFSAAPAALDFWRERLTRNNVAVTRRTRFDEDVLAFTDADAIPIEIVADADDRRSGWDGVPAIPAEYALRGLHTTELTVRQAVPTETLLTAEMGYQLVRRSGERARFQIAGGGPGRFIDVVASPATPAGSGGTGTIHHVAWRVADDEAQIAMQRRLAQAGYRVSPVMDRDYFHSIYYREHGGILFEIATDVPGFSVDEAAEALGTELRLPKQFAHARAAIQHALPPLPAPKQFT